MAIINSVISWFIKKRMNEINAFKERPIQVQEELLQKLLIQAKDTEWGKHHDFASITSPNVYRERVNINDYDTLKADIQRMHNGEADILWKGHVRYFAKSSGTTSDKSKFIPVSEDALFDCHFKAGKDMLSLYYNEFPDSAMFDGHSLVMGGSHKISKINKANYYEGDLSAIIIQNLPFWARTRKTPPLSIALMDEWESKIEKMAIKTMNQDITSIAGVPSWTLVLLKRILELKNTQNLKEVWPNLEVFFHGGVSFKPYVTQYNQFIPVGSINYMETYNASEGFFAIQDQKNSDELLLMLDYGIFYEFLPIEQLNSHSPKTLLLDEVEIGKNYALIISTNGGLWRYMIGDTVIFTCLQPFRIKISGRTKNFINAVGEELIIDNAEKALAIACYISHSTINDYSAAPIYFNNENNAAHEWFIEFENPPADMNLFIKSLDDALKSVNSDYEAKRQKNLVLREPVICALPKGSFYKWLKSNGKLGGQNKVPRLYNNRKYADSILEFLSKQRG